MKRQRSNEEGIGYVTALVMLGGALIWGGLMGLLWGWLLWGAALVSRSA
ncbi:MAG: hypothetical protein ACOCUN_00330 [Jiangellaceae bacterium]